MQITLRGFSGIVASSIVTIIAGCGARGMGSGDTGDIADPHVSSIEGELRVLISDHDDLSTQRRYFLGTDAGADFELLFDAPPVATAGARVRVDGALVDTLTWHV